LRNIGFKTEYPSSAQALKLWRLLKEHNEKSTYELTVGTTDPLIAKEMAPSSKKHRLPFILTKLHHTLAMLVWLAVLLVASIKIQVADMV
jgi:hypothetical protein